MAKRHYLRKLKDAETSFSQLWTACGLEAYRTKGSAAEAERGSGLIIDVSDNLEKVDCINCIRRF